jgi:hypothetical protein
MPALWSFVVRFGFLLRRRVRVIPDFLLFLDFGTLPAFNSGQTVMSLTFLTHNSLGEKTHDEKDTDLNGMRGSDGCACSSR